MYYIFTQYFFNYRINKTTFFVFSSTIIFFVDSKYLKPSQIFLLTYKVRHWFIVNHLFLYNFCRAVTEVYLILIEITNS